AGFLAQGYKPADACVLGVFSHGLAGDMAAKKKGEAGIIASDVADFMPEALQSIYNGENEEFFIRIR
ncbi:MAG: hypothetical protein ACRENF_02540, partial [Thermodesulfobacteriota bacterium]